MVTIKKNYFAEPEHIQQINRKSVDLLRHFMTRFGAIKPRKYTHISVKQQKMVRQAILRARELGLLPYLR